jgi:ubiquinone/menaquinone biosynthesis C-methylase UbiE
MDDKKIKQVVKKRYAKIAQESSSCCTSCTPCGYDVAEQAKKIGYSEKELEQLPREAVMGLGCGNPTALAELKEGETVLDLGAGAGIDAFLAARKVGPKGYVIGVDMTEPMVEKANKIAQRDGYKNVEFRLGEIENLPVKDNSIDVIISNCVINLSPDKLRTYKEAYRVLKRGGRILISDLVTEGKLPDHIKRSFDAWAACIGGAMEKEEYLGVIRKAGFRKIDVVAEHTYSEPSLHKTLAGKITSIQVKAYK